MKATVGVMTRDSGDLDEGDSDRMQCGPGRQSSRVGWGGVHCTGWGPGLLLGTFSPRRVLHSFVGTFRAFGKGPEVGRWMDRTCGRKTVVTAVGHGVPECTQTLPVTLRVPS